ncbi:MAG: serine protease [Bacteroidaceae bacterium]|nr:serine protease [Bacteroidaceae bacterium]
MKMIGCVWAMASRYGMWIMHPSADVDLCVLPTNPLLEAAKKNGKHLFYRHFDNTIIPNEIQKESLDAVEEINMVGYPNGLWYSINNMPIIRKGITATNYNIDYNGKKEFLIDAACFPGSSGSPVLICNVGGYRDKQGNLKWGSSRVYLLGILYAGPQLTVTGDIQIVTIPTAQQRAMSVSHIPNNLGYIIKSERILDFIPIFERLINK